MELVFYPLDANYTIEDNKPVIQLFGVVNGRHVILKDKNFTPYFYAEPFENQDIVKLIKDIKELEVIEFNSLILVHDAIPIKRLLNDKETNLVRVECKLPNNIFGMRKEVKNLVKEVYEYDIPFARRYLIDKGITPMEAVKVIVENKGYNGKCDTYEIVNIISSEGVYDTPKILSFDIETYNLHGKIIDMDKNPILMIAIYGKDFSKVITWKKTITDPSIEVVADEVELILRFVHYVKEYKPDMLVGYYSDKFDLPYIIERAKRLGIELDLNVDSSKINFKKGVSTSVELRGIVHFDVFNLVRKVLANSVDNFSLDTVGEKLAGIHKNKVDIEKLAERWDNNDNVEEYCYYNLQDAKVTYVVAEKLMPNLIELVRIVGLTPSDVSRMPYSVLVEWYAIKQAVIRSQVIPNKPRYTGMEDGERKYEGAFVFEPTPGLYENIVVFDFRSLYPSIIISHNISPSSIKCDCCRDSSENRIKDYWYCSKKKGFTAEILKELVLRRMRIKEMIAKEGKNPLLDARSYGLKILSNAFYGYYGFSAARWYCLECADSVTAFGRRYITEVIEKANKAGFKVIYSDTDSIFLLLGSNKVEDAKMFVSEINRKLPELMELEFEGSYTRGIFVQAKSDSGGAKKRYALISDKGKLKITGFEAVRKNISEIAKETQKEVLKMILEGNDKKKAFDYVTNVIKDIRNRKVSADKMVISTQITKELKDYDAIGPHVAIARKLEEQGEKIGPGRTVDYIIGNGEGLIRDRAKLPEEIEDNNYDSEYYIKNQVVPAIEQIFNVLGYKKEELLENKKQSKLDSFFG